MYFGSNPEIGLIEENKDQYMYLGKIRKLIHSSDSHPLNSISEFPSTYEP